MVILTVHSCLRVKNSRVDWTFQREPSLLVGALSCRRIKRVDSLVMECLNVSFCRPFFGYLLSFLEKTVNSLPPACWVRTCRQHPWSRIEDPRLGLWPAVVRRLQHKPSVLTRVPESRTSRASWLQGVSSLRILGKSPASVSWKETPGLKGFSYRLSASLLFLFHPLPLLLPTASSSWAGRHCFSFKHQLIFSLLIGCYYLSSFHPLKMCWHIVYCYFLVSIVSLYVTFIPLF